ncbi:MAG: PilZ domain-containing protein [Gemmataceae bacterium]
MTDEHDPEQQQDDGDDRRAFVRHRSKPETPSFAITGEEEIITWKARVRDISRGGISLLVNSSFPENAVVEIELPNPEADVSRILPARVVRCSTQNGVHYTVACAFLEELTDDEIKALV